MEHGTTSHQFSDADWDEYATCYDALLHLRPYQKLLEEVCTHFTLTDDDALLDAGCGTGNILKTLRMRGLPTSRLYGVDHSPAMLTRARQKLNGFGMTLLSADLNQTLPFSACTFSHLVSVNVLYAVADPKRTLNEFSRVLREGGEVVVVTPKHGCDSGLVLKEHAQSTLPEEHWREPYRSPEREEMLLREAITDEATIEAMLLVARYNRTITRASDFHFFTREGLEKLFAETSLRVRRISSVYADQAFLVIAVKE